MRSGVVIPARYASERFPGKPLAPICGVPMVVHVLRQARRASLPHEVIVATDDERIVDVVERDGGTAVLVRGPYASGTDRVAAVAAQKDWDYVVNLQGDEPLMAPAVIDQLLACARTDAPDVCTAILPLKDARDLDEPNVVKVVRSSDGFALYFSRSPIPHRRSTTAVPLFKHLGIYCYRRDFLFRFCAMPPSPLEKAESLEQLRILEAGHRIRVIETAHDSLGVDTPADLARVEAVLSAEHRSA